MITQSALFFYNSFPGLIDFIKNYFENLPRELKILRYKESAEFYIAKSIAIAFLTFSFSITFLTIFLNVLIKDIISSLSISFLFSSILSVFTFLIYIKLPSIKISNLSRAIDRELHESLYTFSVFVNDKTPLHISINNFIRSNPQYKLSKELNDIVKLMEFGGLDIISAIDKKIELTPSTKLTRFLFGLSSTIKSGGSIKNYVSTFAKDEIEEYRNKIRESGRKAAMIIQIYLIALVIGGMFINLIISIFSLVQPMEGIVEIQFFLTFILIPLVSLMIAQLIKTIII